MAAARIHRLRRRPGGGVLSGQVTLRLAPRALEHLTATMEVVLVSGTNGKTTTTRFIAEMLSGVARVVSNDTGANMPAGLVAALIRQRSCDYAVLEVDERYLATVCAQTSPAAVVLLNLSRDQLDRNPEIALLAATWRGALRGQRTQVIANCDDPNVYWAVSESLKPIWVSAGNAWPQDSWSCPSCGWSILREEPGHWSCARCPVKRPQPHWRAEDEKATYVPEAQSYALELRLPGRANIMNSVMALATVASLGHSPCELADRLKRVESVAGRYAVFTLFGRDVRLLLAKNPASWIETLHTIKDSACILIMLNSRQLDGEDTSWIWDVPFERLRGKSVFVGGERWLDLALRLDVANVDFDVVSSPQEACTREPNGRLEIVANYTAFLELVVRAGRARQT